ncbi:TetR/AcrR family transcriptional regulator [Propionibacterium australiense]|uniref:Homeobox domain-like n=1 Tax=Propionibacterium australiense TaxID=119981 RepID=A0A383S7M9_9ACTN|nr:TetR family transcriptional regulator [Propionibacterium australiense]RLP11077.1 TetR family transcriptional regulator [Propionibacterium australiense]RLP12401.1 TetR family transcriptional regulator [Propionibacterium australiense]SYZ34005.1 Homeobox domain-like [Propionibacterium australiense]VEH91338.1 transcriptional regulator BetI [Propionibacterium australiense]
MTGHADDRTGTGAAPGHRRRAGAEATRAALIASARELFAAKGYAGASVRAIASGAGVDPSLINHYFGGKEGLFGQAMQIPLDPQEVLARFEQVTSAQELPELVARTFIEIWEGPETGPQTTALLRRALFEEPERLSVLVDFLFSALVEPVSARLGEPGPEQARLRMTLLASHLMGTLVARKILRIEPLASLPADELHELILPTIRADLTGPAGKAPENTPQED